MITIRIATAEDYPELARIATAAFPEYPSTAEEFLFNDSHRDPKCRHGRWAAEREGQIVGFGGYSQNAGAYHPRKFGVDVTVPPELQGQGIGKALYDHLIRELKPFDPLSVRSQIREDMARGVRFLEDRGFVVDMRSWESRLDVASFDPSPYADLDVRMEELGIEIKTLAELEHAPGHLHKHYELSQELIADVPSTEPHTRVDKALWQKRLYENPDLIREAFLIAVHGEEYVGVSVLWNSQGSDDLYTGLTAIRRPYRRQGIALALKLRAIAWAKANNKPVIKTWNETNNRAMLGINERLGYVRQPTWLEYVKVWKEEPE